jgi:hypothetical protein
MTDEAQGKRAADAENDHALSHVLEQLEAAVEGRVVSVGDVVEKLGRRSFPAVILIPALLAASPASGIPGLTAVVGLIVALVVAQMLWNRECLWLPAFIATRTISAERLCQAIGWMRRPVGFAERFLRPRLTFLMARPMVLLPLLVMLAIALFMPVMEIVPTSGSIAGTAVAFFAASLLTRDGLLMLVSFAFVVAAPLLIWQFAG